MTDKAAEAGKAVALAVQGILNGTFLSAFKYLIHLALAFVVAWALRHGIHISVDWIGLGSLTFFGAMLSKLVLHDLAYGWAVGRAAGDHHQTKQQAVADMTEALKAMASLNVSKAPDQSGVSGAYL